MLLQATVRSVFEGDYHHSTFRDTKKYSNNHEFVEIACYRGTCCNQTECDNKERKVIFRTDFLQKDIRRDFNRSVWKEKSTKKLTPYKFYAMYVRAMLN